MGMIGVVMVAGVVDGYIVVAVVRVVVMRMGALRNNLTCRDRMEIRLVRSRRGEREQKNADHRQKGGAKIGKSAFLSNQHKGSEY